jgi:dienelactone hydrolase
MLAAFIIPALTASCGSPGTTTTSTVPLESTTSLPASPADQARIDRLTEKALQFVDLLVEERFADAHATFDDTMKSALPVDQLEAAWAEIQSQVGDYAQPVAVRHEADAQYVAIIVQAEFEQAPLDIRVVYDRDDLVSGLFFQPAQGAYESPPYADPAAFTEGELIVGSAPWELPATLTLPTGLEAGEGPFPAVVLVHGSGPNDRDETIGPNKPFRDLAEGLATAGVAVLRYEKRTLHYAEELAAAEGLTVQEETVDDALAAVEALRMVPEISAEDIFVLGHSLGGMMVPRIGVVDSGVAGFIVAAGAAQPLEDLILEQTGYLLSLEEEPTAEQLSALADLEEQVERVKDPGLSLDTPADQLPLSIPAAYWLDLRGYDPPALARDLGRPLLVIQGDRDYQVTELDFSLWKAAFETVPGVEFILYPQLNHLFMAGEGPSRPTEYLRPGHVAEEVILDIARFIHDSAGR